MNRYTQQRLRPIDQRSSNNNFSPWRGAVIEAYRLVSQRRQIATTILTPQQLIVYYFTNRRKGSCLMSHVRRLSRSPDSKPD